MLHQVVSAAKRYGGILVQPRATAAELTDGEGRHDGAILSVLYIVGSHLYPLADATANSLATRDFNGLVLLGSAVARVLVPPVLILMVAEALLGRGRSHRRGLSLVPLVVVTALAHLAKQNGVGLGGPSYLPEIVGGVLGVALAWHIKPAVEPTDEEEDKDEDEEEEA